MHQSMMKGVEKRKKYFIKKMHDLPFSPFEGKREGEVINACSCSRGKSNGQIRA